MFVPPAAVAGSAAAAATRQIASVGARSRMSMVYAACYRTTDASSRRDRHAACRLGVPAPRTGRSRSLPHRRGVQRGARLGVPRAIY